MIPAWELKHCKSVSAIALAYNGKHAGNIVANWSDNPAGSVCTATVSIWLGPLAELPKSTAKAGGCGYDKFSAAMYTAFSAANHFPHISKPCPDSGRQSVYSWLQGIGYVVMEVL